MATGGNIEYWQGWTNGTATTTADFMDNVTSDSTTTINFCTYFIPRPRRILVEEPKNWSDADADAFIRLVNIETKTGWIVEFRIRGNIVITDPDIEVRSMADFVPLLAQRAKGDDARRIKKFFEKHPATNEGK